MPIFKLRKQNNNIENAELIPAEKTSIEFERHLESWIENSPWAIAQEPLLIIGRQTSASQDEYETIFPDLLGIDKEGNLVIIEIKKGRTPREVIAQLLEYAAWANDLSEDKIRDIATIYFNKTGVEKDIETLFSETFEADEFPLLNQMLRLFVAAEEISPSVAKVCRFLRQIHGVDVNCIKFNIYQTESGEILVNSEEYVGLEDVVASRKRIATQRWTGEVPVRQVVWEAVLEFTKSDKEKLFSTRDIRQIVLEKYPTFNKSTLGCQIIADCVNHTSRHHYPGGEDRYWRVEKGKYKLYDQSVDK